MHDEDYRKALNARIEAPGGRDSYLGTMLIELSRTGQPCDITLYEGQPLLDVKIDQQLNLALMYGAGPERLKQLLDNLKLSDGRSVQWGNIWTVNPMPRDGLSAADLAAVDLSDGDAIAGPNGETLRQMVRETYKAETPESEEMYLRRFLAS